MKAPKSITRNGERFERHAGPFHSLFDAYDYVESLVAYGEITEDQAFVDHDTGMIYLLSSSPPTAPE